MDDAFDNWLHERESEAEADDGRLSPGTVIGAYRIEAFLGRGGFAEVYRARGQDGEHVAIKMLHRLDEQSRLRFERESSILSRIRHPNIPQLLSFGSCGDRPYLVTELLQTKELPHTDKTVARFIKSVCAAADALHKMGYVHRDIKPSNVLWRGDTPVLIDFGLACLKSETPRSPSTISIVDGQRIVVGTAGYAAPEQFAGGKIDETTDVHAIGMLADACFNSRPPNRWRRIIQRATNSMGKARYATAQMLSKAVRCRYVDSISRISSSFGLFWLFVTVLLAGVAFYYAHKFANFSLNDFLPHLHAPSQVRAVANRALYVPERMSEEDFGELSFLDWCEVLKRRPELFAHLPRKRFNNSEWGTLLSYVTELPDERQLAKLSGVAWVKLLLSHPEQIGCCDFLKIDSVEWNTAWDDMLLAFPDFTNRCDFSEMNRYAIKAILLKHPSLVNRFNLSKLTGYEWIDLLLMHPSFEKYCDFTLFSGHDWKEILRKTSRYDDRCDFEKLNGDDWVELLTCSSRFDEFCRYDKLNGENWSRLLITTSRFDDVCIFEKLSPRDWGELLSTRRTFTNKCQRIFRGRDAIVFLRGSPQLWIKCDFESLSAYEWGELLKDNPQLVSHWRPVRYSETEWKFFAFSYFDRTDGGQLCKDKFDALHLADHEAGMLRKYVLMPRNGKEEKQVQYARMLKDAEKGDGTAMVTIGSWYQGQGRDLPVKRDYEKAVAWYKKGVAVSNQYAMSKLGECYQYGIGMPTNITKAIELYRLAAGQPYGAHGAFKLAECYENGIGVEKDGKKALMLCRKAARVPYLPNWLSKTLYYRLGRYYENGIGVAKDIDEAIYWYDKSSKLGHGKAKERIALLKPYCQPKHIKSAHKLLESVHDNLSDFSMRYNFERENAEKGK